MQVEAIQTHRIEPKASLADVLDQYVTQLQEETVLAVTSKIVSLCEGRVVPKGQVSKDRLVREEAQAVLIGGNRAYGIQLTLVKGQLMPCAGIDESNVQEAYLLLPKDSQATAVAIWKHLRQRHHVQHLGVLLTDSRTLPLRMGVSGVALGWCGFEPLFSYVGLADLYGRSMSVTRLNVLDSLACAATYVMGEGAECTPMAKIQGAPKVHFQTEPPTQQAIQSLRIPMELDLYGPLLQAGQWA